MSRFTKVLLIAGLLIAGLVGMSAFTPEAEAGGWHGYGGYYNSYYTPTYYRAYYAPTYYYTPSYYVPHCYGY